MKITGLDGLTKQLEEAQKALSALDGELGTVNFDPNDAGSIEAAIQQIEMMIDDRVGAYASNPIVGPLIESVKEQYREGIIQKAAAARLKSASDD
jgi:ABC-type sugar transport system substrate-binding protein